MLRLREGHAIVRRGCHASGYENLPSKRDSHATCSAEQARGPDGAGMRAPKGGANCLSRCGEAGYYSMRGPEMSCLHGLVHSVGYNLHHLMNPEIPCPRFAFFLVSGILLGSCSMFTSEADDSFIEGPLSV